MPSDTELFLERHTLLANMPSHARAAETLADRHGLSVDSVRSRLSRAEKDPANLIKLARIQAVETESVPPSVERQENIVRLSNERFRFEKYNTQVTNRAKAVFVSDLHAPYTRWDGVEIAAAIISDTQPAFVSAMNDLNDYRGYKWADTRPTRGKLWSGDVAYTRRLEKTIYGIWNSAMNGSGSLVAVGANHDNWYLNDYLRAKTPEVAEERYADYMEWLYTECGVLQLTVGDEAEIELSDGLVWWHGQFTSTPVNNARNTLKQFMKDGRARSVVVGHTHRPIHIPGFAVGYDGVNFYNNGCLCGLEKVPYMKRQPQGWGLAVTVCEYDPNGRWEHCEVVNMVEENNRLVARYGGKTYSVALDKSTPQF